SLASKGSSLHLQPGSLIIHQTSQFNLSLHIGQLKLYGLKRADRLAELLALACIAQGLIETCLRQPYRERGNTYAPTIQDGHELFETIAPLTQDARFGDNALLK